METTEILWQNFQAKYELTLQQLNQFKKYAALLYEWNQKINLTAMDSEADIINYHFDDSLAVSKFVDFSKLKSVSDVGTGAGFPGIPIKIKYPHLNVVLIEVTQKKINFLDLVIEELNLEDIEVYELNWLTFLRKTDYKIDTFFARASLKTDELLQAYSKDSNYKSSKLIYWASIKWQATAQDSSYLKKIEKYNVGEKERQLIFFAK
ncbi:MAG: 16S rRNA (guanine(527)-N(7))-methyltransferase RsmG [Candidatus Babeliales bacterium]|nr:16S rRNA (guanine(527)-N(7))-methyltransferase RsmG [Candidatus Babeliales bacterium]